MYLRSRYGRHGALPLPKPARPLTSAAHKTDHAMMVTAARLAIADAMTRTPGKRIAGDAEQPCDDHLGGAAHERDRDVIHQPDRRAAHARRKQLCEGRDHGAP